MRLCRFAIRARRHADQIVWGEPRDFLANSVRYFEIDELNRSGGCIFANGEIFTGYLGERMPRRLRQSRTFKEKPLVLGGPGSRLSPRPG